MGVLQQEVVLASVRPEAKYQSYRNHIINGRLLKIYLVSKRRGCGMNHITGFKFLWLPLYQV